MKKLESICPKCNGTGNNNKLTAEQKQREPSLSGTIRCWNCSGNGWDPVDGFNWTKQTGAKDEVSSF